MLIILALVTLPLTHLARTQPAWAQEPDCTDPGSLPQQGMNYCAAKEFEQADAALNAAWELLRPSAVKGSDGADPMLEGQRAWIRYRDGQCKAEGLHFEVGSLEPLIVATCRTRMTQARTQELLLMERYR
ncbi:MAG: lysozyme inhibitor LprI family protein [Pseudomonadota bacterium]